MDLDAKRQLLRDRGWREVLGYTRGVRCWRRPDGAVLLEDEAFLWERLQ